MRLDEIDIGDVIAIRGSGLVSNLICDFTGVISHVGMATRKGASADEIEVTQARTTVETLTLAETIAGARYAYALHALDLSGYERQYLRGEVLNKRGVGYDYLDLLWQAADKTFRTDWFTEQLHSGGQEICSELVGQAYAAIGRNFAVPAADATPSDLFDYALANPARWAILPLKGLSA
jgi:hypothetical protein